jgi:hypothetical protein
MGCKTGRERRAGRVVVPYHLLAEVLGFPNGTVRAVETTDYLDGVAIVIEDESMPAAPMGREVERVSMEFRTVPVGRGRG